MKTFSLILLFSSTALFSHEIHDTPEWIREYLNNDLTEESRVHG